MARHEARRWIALLREGLVPVALGLILASDVAMMRAADTNLLVGMSLGTALFVVFSPRNPLRAFGVVTLPGVAAQRPGWM